MLGGKSSSAWGTDLTQAQLLAPGLTAWRGTAGMGTGIQPAHGSAPKLLCCPTGRQ